MSYWPRAALPASMIVDVSVMVIVWFVVLRRTVSLPAVLQPVMVAVPTVPTAASLIDV